MIGWWPLQEGEGERLQDASGNGYDGEWFGEMPPQWKESEAGPVLVFDGADGAVVTPVVEELRRLGREVTLMAWVWREEGGAEGTVLDTWVGEEVSGSFGLWLSAGRPVFEAVSYTHLRAH
ncbi:MAG: hypothetical protein N3A53_06065, partial [Verrucomicrobiae bacterium]|nr:hypothetical protein [Verrucomicrobiae bacterium]